MQFFRPSSHRGGGGKKDVTAKGGDVQTLQNLQLELVTHFSV